MKTVYALVIAFILFAATARAISISGMSVSPPSGSQYFPGNYTFQITPVLDNNETITNITLEIGVPGFGAGNDTDVYNISNTYFVNMTGLYPMVPPNAYTYRWFIQVNNSNWISTGLNQYQVLKNSSVPIKLYVNGTRGNITYPLGSIINLTAYLDLNRQILVNTTCPGLYIDSISASLSNSSHTYMLNITTPGSCSATAYWNGDISYSPSNETFYLSDFLPMYSSVTESPASAGTYGAGPYKFSSIWAGNISQAWFEVNQTGTFVNYTVNSAPAVQNSSNIYSITFQSMAAADFVYRWYANDSIGRTSNTDYIPYHVYKENPLQLSILPSINVTAGTETVARCIVITGDLSADNFNLYRDSTLIPNDTLYSRKDDQTFNIGSYNYICNTTGSQNYTNQTINYTLVVITNQTPLRVFAIIGQPSIDIDQGGSGEYIFKINNTMGYAFHGLSVTVNGLNTSWYTVGDIASDLPDSISIQGKIDFNIPSSVPAGSHTFTVRATGLTLSNVTNQTSESVILNINVPQQKYYPPVYSPETANASVNGNDYEFALKWTDAGQMKGFIFSSNITGAWENDSLVAVNGTDTWSYAKKNATLVPGTDVAWKFYMVDSNNSWSASETFDLNANKTAGVNLTAVIIVGVVIAIFAVAFFFLSRKKKTKPKQNEGEPVTFVYKQEDIKQA